MDVMERIERKVERIPFSGCWIWTGSVRSDGYPRMSHKGQTLKVSTVIYELAHGARNGLHVLHGCDTPLCVNPHHLSLGTHQENMQQKHSRRGATGRAQTNAAKTQCVRGHPLSGDNLIVSNGRRICRECGRARSRAHYHKATKGVANV
jgi:hypothetical protein